MRAIVTVLGKDRVGIMSTVCALLEREGKERDLSIRAQREDIFNAMHRI